jgi:hypothetical protein
MVWRAPRHEDHGASPGLMRRVSNAELQDPFQEDEGLVLRVVDVTRGPVRAGTTAWRSVNVPSGLGV